MAVPNHHYGRHIAQRWRDLLNDLDKAWLAMRRHGVGRAEPVRSTGQRRGLWLDRTLADLVYRLGHEHLAAIVLDGACLDGTCTRSAPAVLAVHLSVERTFGHWHLTTEAGKPQSMAQLSRCSVDRLRIRKVITEEEEYVPCTPDIGCSPRRPR